jgi:hypothetical protein
MICRSGSKVEKINSGKGDIIEMSPFSYQIRAGQRLQLAGSLFFLKFYQYLHCRPWMDKGHGMARRTWPCIFVYQFDPLFIQSLKSRIDIVYLKTEMMDTGAAFANELCDGTFGSDTHEKLYGGIASREERYSQPSVREVLFLDKFEAEYVTIETFRFIEIFDSYSDMIQIFQFFFDSSSIYQVVEPGSYRPKTISSVDDISPRVHPPLTASMIGTRRFSSEAAVSLTAER